MHPSDSKQQKNIKKNRYFRIRLFFAGLITVKICAWCQLPMGLRSRILMHFINPNDYSHGMCPACREVNFKEFVNGGPN